MRDKEGFRFDLVTQRFLKGRWETPTGTAVLKEVVDGIKGSSEIRGILDDYVLDHPANSDPYGHPYYPPDAMTGGVFWVLTQDDLRGARFIGEDFSNAASFPAKALSYASFYHCNLSSANLERVDLSYARLEECDLTDTCFAGAGGCEAQFLNCIMRKACLWRSSFLESDFSGSDLSGAYLEDAALDDLIVNYRTRFDEDLASTWRTRTLPASRRPDLLRTIRLGFARQEIWDTADRFLYRERVERRRHITWPGLKARPRQRPLLRWLGDWLSGGVSGYGTKPARVVAVAAGLSLAFAAFYFMAGVPAPTGAARSNLLQALYFSFTSFATLGYGDVTYPASRPWLRLASTAEAWTGAVVLALFVTALARKAFR